MTEDLQIRNLSRTRRNPISNRFRVSRDMLLMLIQPTGEGHDEKGKWIESSAHGAGNYRPECRLTLQSFQSD
jgi:hypothetical protein